MGLLATAVALMSRRSAFICLSAVALAACDGRQSALQTAGTDAEQIAHLFRVMMAGALIVWALVVAAAIYAIRVKRGTHTEREANLFVIGGGVLLPVLVLGGLLWYGLPLLPQVMALAPADALRIHITGKQWWWRVQYATPDGFIETANEVRLPVGQRVELQLTSPDVIHSFWVPSIAGKMDMIPGRLTRLGLEPTRTGVFRGACAEYCGASHALMAFDVIVTSEREFRDWLSAQAQPAQTPADAPASRGQEVFQANGCTACHTIRGMRTAARIGPDLTHVASRLRVGAGTLVNSPEALVTWIRDTDRVKPGVHMPAFRALTPDDLAALAAYLGSLQ
jgi:cytochrome c oxidase subunit 2